MSTSSTIQKVPPTNLWPKFLKIQAIHGEKTFVMCLPKDFVRELEIRKGDYVKCSISNKQLIVEKTEINNSLAPGVESGEPDEGDDSPRRVVYDKGQ